MTAVPQAYRITDIHVHIQPWRDLKPNVQAVMRAGKEEHWDFLLSLMDDPQALLQVGRASCRERV